MNWPRYLHPAWEIPEIYLYRAPVDFRKQANSLLVLVDFQLPTSHQLYKDSIDQLKPDVFRCPVSST